MKCYKLTDQDNLTCGGCRWGENVTHAADGSGELCSSGWLHFYENALVGLLMNTQHAMIPQPRLWLAESGEIIKRDRWLKAGSTKLTTIRELPLPTITAEKRAEFAIRSALEVCTDSTWITWAKSWLSGEDRRPSTALAATDALAKKARADDYLSGVNAALSATAAAFDYLGFTEENCCRTITVVVREVERRQCERFKARFDEAFAAYSGLFPYAASNAADMDALRTAAAGAAEYAGRAIQAYSFPWKRIVCETFTEPEFAEYLPD